MVSQADKVAGRCDNGMAGSLERQRFVDTLIVSGEPAFVQRDQGRCQRSIGSRPGVC